LQTTQIEQRRAWQRINQQIKIAAFLVSATQHRAKDARIRRAKAARHFTDDTSLEVLIETHLNSKIRE
jgi:hypothetical protein